MLKQMEEIRFLIGAFVFSFRPFEFDVSGPKEFTSEGLRSRLRTSFGDRNRGSDGFSVWKNEHPIR